MASRHSVGHIHWKVYSGTKLSLAIVPHVVDLNLTVINDPPFIRRYRVAASEPISLRARVASKTSETPNAKSLKGVSCHPLPFFRGGNL